MQYGVECKREIREITINTRNERGIRELTISARIKRGLGSLPSAQGMLLSFTYLVEHNTSLIKIIDPSITKTLVHIREDCILRQNIAHTTRKITVLIFLAILVEHDQCYFAVTQHAQLICFLEQPRFALV